VRHRIEAGGERGAGFGDALPAIDRLFFVARLHGRPTAVTARQSDYVALAGRRPRHVAGRIRIERRTLASGALPQHAAQAQENENREREENDGVDIEHSRMLPGRRLLTDRARRGQAPPPL
jgi:hypothetical protein